MVQNGQKPVQNWSKLVQECPKNDPKKVKKMAKVCFKSVQNRPRKVVQNLLEHPVEVKKNRERNKRFFAPWKIEKSFAGLRRKAREKLPHI